MNVSNSYPTDKYPQLTSPSLAKNREEALAQAIAMIEGCLPNTSAPDREKTISNGTATHELGRIEKSPSSTCSYSGIT
ncbi:Uncharacterised protein [Proteus mirabilis]|uniref:Uncharacterized protein n=1 Tax=Proteus mirabilis TaxID=584 RepID=A0A2X2C9H1_PROMI|nr:Uncharacterised protein [Proteus mirabilis]